MKAAALSELSIEYVREALLYRDGELYWRERPLSHFADERAQKGWNTRYAGTAVGAHLHSAEGYRMFRLGYRHRKYHRVLWAVVYGVWPTVIDHINGDRADNRIENLREVTRSENLRNIRLKSNNTSGRVGVRWNAGRWQAEGTVHGRVFRLGRYMRFEDACAAREQFERENGFSPRHGERHDLRSFRKPANCNERPWSPLGGAA